MKRKTKNHTLLLVGSRKGAFLLRGDAFRPPWRPEQEYIREHIKIYTISLF